MRAIYRFFRRFKKDNNFRFMVIFWLGLAHLLFNLIVFGFGPATDFFPIPEEVQRYRNLEFRGRFATDRELNPPSWFSEAGGSLWASLRWWSWTVFGVMFVVNIISFPFSRRDEWHRFRRAMGRAIRERRGSPAAAPPPPATPAAPAAGAVTGGARRVAGGVFGELFVVLREIMGATIANLITHRGR